MVRITRDGIDLNAVVTRLEREMILQSLALSGGNKARAAELLRLKRTTFVEKMKRLEILEEDPVPRISD
jgi:DNA-binding NtrC family response regulator